MNCSGSVLGLSMRRGLKLLPPEMPVPMLKHIRTRAPASSDNPKVLQVTLKEPCTSVAPVAETLPKLSVGWVAVQLVLAIACGDHRQ